jgi:hypothetical protein
MMGRAALTSLLWLAAATPALGQGVSAAAGRFQASWGQEDARALEAMMAPAVRLDVEGEAHLGVPPRQAAATLSRLFDRYAPAAPEIVRHREPEAGSERGFAEFRWSPLTAQTAEPSPYVIFVVFRSEGPELRIAELRVLR